MKKAGLIFGFLWSLWSYAQDDAVLNVAVDTTTVKIGAQLNYTLQVKADSTAQVVFPEQPLFAPFELLEESPIDTLRTQAHFLYTKKYALIQFDSGNYFLPQQQVLVNGFSKIADIIPIRVNTVEVDTLKQNLFEIKPLQEVKKNYDALISQILWGLLIAFLLIGSLYTYLFQKRRKELRAQEKPPFERAIEALKALENEAPQDQEAFKDYYSRLTDVVRRYLEEDAKVDALESTTNQLVLKLEMLRDAGELTLEKQTIKRLKNVLENADLVKFAKSVPEFGMAKQDRIVVEGVVIETKEVLPEPTEEELREQAAYKEMMLKKRRKERLIWGVSGVGLLLVIGIISSMLVYGFHPVKDTLFRYPTKLMLDANWVKSEYGTPPLRLETPQVLERLPSDDSTVKEFVMGNFDAPFYVSVRFDFPKPSQADLAAPQQDPKEADLEKGKQLVAAIISNFESQGAVNILIKDDAVTLPSGLPVAKLYGTLDYPRKGAEERIRSYYNALLFTFEEGTIIVTLMYEKEDRYAPEIERRIINSLELIKEL